MKLSKGLDERMKCSIFVSVILMAFICTPTHGQFAEVFNVPPDTVPQPVPENSQVNLFDNGELPDNFVAEGSFNFDDIEINIFGGTVGDNVQLMSNVRLNVFGGEIGDDFSNRFPRATIESGTFGDRFSISFNRIEDGVFGDGGTMWGSTISGGQFGSNIRISATTFNGGSFGDGLDFTSSLGEVTDGEFGTTRVSETASLIVSGGNFAGQMLALGTTRIAGGTIDSIQASGIFEMSGGVVLRNLEIGGAAEISGGVVTGDFSAGPLSESTITGGSFESALVGQADADIQVLGGLMKGPISMESGAQLQLVGKEFRLIDIATGALIEDLSPILDSLEPGEAFEIQQRDVAISGVLIDGSRFRYDMNSIPVDGEDFADLTATIGVSRDLTPIIYATNVEQTRGVLISANTLNFDARLSDDRRIRIFRGFALNSTTPLAELRFESTLPFSPASDEVLEFSIESSAGTPGLGGIIEARNFNTGSFDYLASFDAPFNIDTVTTVVLTDEHFDEVTLETLGRITWWQIGFIINNPWEVRVDQAFWSIK